MIFDLDGTLVDSSQDLTDALNHAVSGYRSAAPFAVTEVKQLVGEGVPRLIEKALGEDSRGNAGEVRARFLEYYRIHITDHTKPYPGIQDALDALSGCRKAVVSNKSAELSVQVLTNLGLARFFEMVMGSDSVSETKPSPLPLLTVMERLEAGARESVIVGDSEMDMRAGRNAGIPTCAVTWGFRSREVLKQFHPDFMANHPLDLISFFGGRC